MIASLEGNPTCPRRPSRALLPRLPAPQLLPFSSPFCSCSPRGSRLRSLRPAPGSREPACVLAPPKPRSLSGLQDMEAEAKKGCPGGHCNKG